MSSSQISNLIQRIKKLKEKVEKFEISNNLDVDQNKFDQIEEEYKDLARGTEGIDEIDDNDIKGDIPLLNQFKVQKNDLDIIGNNIETIKKNLNSTYYKDLLKGGKLGGKERKEAQRNMALDNIKETDNQERMLHSIHNNVIESNENLGYVNQEIKTQGDQIKEIGEKVINVGESVKNTGQVMSQIERRICCRKFSLIVGIIVLFLSNFYMLIIIFSKRFGSKSSNKNDSGANPNSNPQQNPNIVKGIQFEYNGKIEYGFFSGLYLTFVLLKGGESTDSNADSFIENLESAKAKNIKVGAYWMITQTSIEEAIWEAKEAYNFLAQLENEGKLKDLSYDFYLKFNGNNQLLNDYTSIEKLCAELQGKKPCGIALSSSKYDYFKNNINRIQKINSYWVEPSGGFDDANAKKLAFWKTTDKVSINNAEFSIIRAK
jgi:GH25 family lysozyme M1 (1,4-beta-N-acetylmuramidase)